MTSPPDTTPDSDEIGAQMRGHRLVDLGRELDLQLSLAAALRKHGDGSEPVAFGKWDVESRLGRGGMGSVYLARDRSLGRRVALKLLVGSDGHDLGREARALAAISDRNVVQVHSIDDSQAPFVVIEMEYVEGTTLRAWQAQPERDWRAIVATYAIAGRGLAAIHRPGLVHRDIKPENILVAASGEVKIVDLGLAIVPRTQPGGEAVLVPLPTSAVAIHTTAEGQVVGTLGYIAPEVLAGHGATASSDQFSLASALFEAVFGNLPFRGATPEAQAAAIRDGLLAIPEQHRAPRWLVDVLRRALSCAPEQRYPDVDTFVRALRRGLARRRLLAALALAIAASAVVAALVWTLKPLPADPCSDAGNAMTAVWSPERRASLANANRADADPRLRRATDLLLETVEGRVRNWEDTSIQLCLSEHRGPQLDPVGRELDRQQRACLEQFRSDLDLLLAPVLVPAEHRPVARLFDTAGAVEALPTCDDRRIFARWPLDAADDSEIAEQLTRSQALEIAGDFVAAERLARPLAERTALHPFRRAQALYQLGHILGTQHQYTAAFDLLHDARALAGLSGHRGLACRAAVYQAKLAANVALDPTTGARELRFAEHCAHSAETAPLFEPELLEARGLLARVAGDLERARAWHRQALDRRRTLLGDEHPDVARSLHNLAITLQDLDDPAAVGHFAAALELRERLFGPDHPDVADVLYDQSASLAPPAARASLARARAIFERAPGRHHAVLANIHITLAGLDRTDDPAAAARHVAAARDLLAQATELPRHHPDRAALELHDGVLALERADFSRARTHLTLALHLYRALDPDGSGVLGTIAHWIEAAVGQRDHIAVTYEVRALGKPLETYLRDLPAEEAGKFGWYIADAFIADGSPAEAVPYLRIALAAYERLDDAGNVAALRWTLARALGELGSDGDAARRLAGAALDFHRLHGPRAQIKTITRWLADTGPRQHPNEP